MAKDALGDMVNTWATLNEPWCVAFLGHSSGEHAPGIADTPGSLVVAHHLMLAHHSAIRAMRETAPRDDDRLGIVLNLIPAWPQNETDEDRAAAAAVDLVQNRLFVDAVPARQVSRRDPVGVRAIRGVRGDRRRMNSLRSGSRSTSSGSTTTTSTTSSMWAGPSRWLPGLDPGGPGWFGRPGN